jgi:hypothetical protein
VKRTERTCPGPEGKIVPAAGVYVKVPGTDAMASSCAGPRGVPEVMSAGSAQVIVGVAGLTVSVPPAYVIV